jgi:hypothetical protein
VGEARGRHPWGSVISVDGGVHLSLTSEAIKELPPVPF